MKVLENGKLSIPWKVEKRCDYFECKAKLLVEEDDVLFRKIGYRDNTFGYVHREYYGFECPECEHVTFLKESQIPLKVKKKARDKYDAN